MKCSHLLLLAVGVPLFASAQADRHVPAAADVNGTVTPLQYHSVFADYVLAKEPQQAPDRGWIRANRAVLGGNTATAEPERQAAPAVAQDKPPAKPVQDAHAHKGAHQ
jgi:hypothetical protein